ncbi:alpha/beta fold hydrolase [Yinghuangia aomiensis]
MRHDRHDRRIRRDRQACARGRGRGSRAEAAGGPLLDGDAVCPQRRRRHRVRPPRRLVGSAAAPGDGPRHRPLLVARRPGRRVRGRRIRGRPLRPARRRRVHPDAGDEDRQPVQGTLRQARRGVHLGGHGRRRHRRDGRTQLAQAHIFGHSMGGLIAQRVALRHPDRVLSVTSSAALPSDVAGLGVLRYLRFGLLAKLARTKFPEGREGDIEASLAVWRGIASPGYPFDEEAARAWVEAEVDSGPRDTKAQSRQIGAQWHGAKLSELHHPTLVLHGEQDPILKVRAAHATAKAIRGARLVTFPGVGHDLPAALWPDVAAEVAAVAGLGTA